MSLPPLLLEGLRSADVLADLGPDEVADLGDAVDVRRLADGEALVRQGEVAGDLFVLTSGRLTVVLEDEGRHRELAVLEPGAIVGEIALVAGGTRDATVRAVGSAEVVTVTGRGLEALIDRRPDIGSRLAGLARDRLRRTRLTGHLTSLFGDLDDDTVEALTAAAAWVLLRAGEVLCEAGDAADGAYIVVSGRLRVLVEDADGAPEVVAEVSRGELVGEMALLEANGRRNATLLAARDTEVAVIPRADFDTLIEAHPAAMLAVTRTVLERTRRPPRLQRLEHTSSIALVPAGPDVDLTGFAERLAARLGQFGEVVHLSRERVDAALGRAGIADADEEDPGAIRLGHWLHELELSTPFVLYETSARWGEWNARAVRHADRLVVVADATADPAPTALEQRFASVLADTRFPTRTLVLRQPADLDQPRATRRWLDPRDVDQHLHVREGHAGDLDRLARWLAGHAVGLVLGGGGARGLAHLGVMRVLHELGVPVDAVGGSSFGAIMAIPPGLDRWGDPALELTATHVSSGLVDYTLPLVSLARGRAVTRTLEAVAGDMDITDMWLPWFCVSTDLTTATERIHREGAVVRAARASVAIPGVFPPVPWDGNLLVDGGMIDNVPVRAMRQLVSSGTVIAVDIAPPLGPRAKEDFGTDLSGWSLLADRVLPRRRRRSTPGISATIMRAMMVAASRERAMIVRDQLADLYLDLPVKGYGLLEFDAVEEIAGVGADLSRERLTAFAEEHATAW